MYLKNNLFVILCILVLLLSYNQILFAQSQLPAIIFVYDDGHIEDIKKAFPIHQKYNVPAVSAVNSSTIGNNNFLEKEDLIKLEKNGWEIASHGKFHSALIYNTLLEDLHKNDKTIKVKNPNLVEKRHDYYIYNSEKNKGEVIKFKKLIENNDEKYWKLDNKLENNYPINNTSILLTQKSMEEEIANAKFELTQMGLKINSFIYPYNGYIDLAKNIVKENYNFARGGRKQNEDFPKCFINSLPFSNYNLKGVSFEKDHLLKEDLNTLLNETKKQKGLLIFYAHTANESFSTDRLEYIIQKATKSGFNIITFDDLNILKKSKKYNN